MKTIVALKILALAPPLLSTLNPLLSTAFAQGTAFAYQGRLVSGNVGIGTATPGEKLHVVGNIFATGSITPNSDRDALRDPGWKCGRRRHCGNLQQRSDI